MAVPKHSFAGVDRVSYVVVPYGHSFITAKGAVARVLGISGLAFAPDNVTLLALCDRSAIFSATVEFDIPSMELKNISWRDRWHVVEGSGGHRGEDVDGEGIAMLPSGAVFVSHEASFVYRLPSWNYWSHATELPTQPVGVLPDYVARGLVSNLAFESLAVRPGTSPWDSPLLILGLEGPLSRDFQRVRRLLEVNATSGEILCQKAVLAPVNNPPLYLTELVALDDAGSVCSGRFLSLWRSWSASAGNEIRVYLLNTAGAEDVSRCTSIVQGDLGGPSDCVLSNLAMVKMDMLLRWAPNLPLDGRVPVDNYEGMVLVPPSALGRASYDDLGGVALLLVNDNNDSPHQVGTQFVLLRLRFAEESAGADDNATIRNSSNGSGFDRGGAGSASTMLDPINENRELGNGESLLSVIVACAAVAVLLSMCVLAGYCWFHRTGAKQRWRGYLEDLASPRDDFALPSSQRHPAGAVNPLGVDCRGCAGTLVGQPMSADV